MISVILILVNMIVVIVMIVVVGRPVGRPDCAPSAHDAEDLEAASWRRPET